MAQIDSVLYNTIAQAYAAIDVSLSGVASNGRVALDAIVDVDTTTYPDATPSVADADAALEIELSLLSPFNSAYTQALGIASNIENLLTAVIAVSNHVITNSSFVGTGKEKLDNWINVEMSGYWLNDGGIYLDGCPQGWANLSEDAGYNVDGWNIFTPIDLTAAIISQYTLNVNAIDSQGNYNGNLFGSPLIVDGRINNAADFNGTDQYMTTGDIPEIVNGSFSVAFWMKSSEASTPIMEKYDPIILNTGFTIDVNLSKLRFSYSGFGGGGEEISNNDVSNGEWVFVVLNYNPIVGVNFYFNNSLDSSHIWGPADVGALDNNGEDIRYARTATGQTPHRYYNGVLDNICIFNRQLTTGEIAFLYNDGNGTELLSNV